MQFQHFLTNPVNEKIDNWRKAVFLKMSIFAKKFLVKDIIDTGNSLVLCYALISIHLKAFTSPFGPSTSTLFWQTSSIHGHIISSYRGVQFYTSYRPLWTQPLSWKNLRSHGQTTVCNWWWRLFSMEIFILTHFHIPKCQMVWKIFKWQRLFASHNSSLNLNFLFPKNKVNSLDKHEPKTLWR